MRSPGIKPGFAPRPGGAAGLCPSPSPPPAPPGWYLQEGEDEADGEVAEPVEGPPHDVGSRAMRLCEELCCHQEGDTGCGGRGQVEGMGDRLPWAPLGSTGPACLSPTAKGLEPCRTHGPNWWSWEGWRTQGAQGWVVDQCPALGVPSGPVSVGG